MFFTPAALKCGATIFCACLFISAAPECRAIIFSADVFCLAALEGGAIDFPNLWFNHNDSKTLSLGVFVPTVVELFQLRPGDSAFAGLVLSVGKTRLRLFQLSPDHFESLAIG